jgi:hypothetical protein
MPCSTERYERLEEIIRRACRVVEVLADKEGYVSIII